MDVKLRKSEIFILILNLSKYRTVTLGTCINLTQTFKQILLVMLKRYPSFTVYTDTIFDNFEI